MKSAGKRVKFRNCDIFFFLFLNSAARIPDALTYFLAQRVMTQQLAPCVAAMAVGAHFSDCVSMQSVAALRE